MTNFQAGCLLLAARLVLIAELALPCFGQSTLATISGVVTDSQGAAISGATVSANQIATGEHFTVKTNQSGFYSIPNLAVGAYSLTIEQTGFHRYVHENITL